MVCRREVCSQSVTDPPKRRIKESETRPNEEFAPHPHPPPRSPAAARPEPRDGHDGGHGLAPLVTRCALPCSIALPHLPC